MPDYLVRTEFEVNAVVKFDHAVRYGEQDVGGVEINVSGFIG
jgi:hypothetical protein